MKLVKIAFTFAAIVYLLTTMSIIERGRERKAFERRLEEEAKIVTEDAICHLSSIITAECETCTEEEKYLIGSVVLNRARHREMTIAEVLAEENQFYGYEGKKYYPTPEHRSIAKKLLNGLNRDHKFLHFFSGDPCWSAQLVNVKRKSWHHTFSY